MAPKKTQRTPKERKTPAEIKQNWNHQKLQLSAKSMQNCETKTQNPEDPQPNKSSDPILERLKDIQRASSPFSVNSPNKKQIVTQPDGKDFTTFGTTNGKIGCL